MPSRSASALSAASVRFPAALLALCLGVASAARAQTATGVPSAPGTLPRVLVGPPERMPPPPPTARRHPSLPDLAGKPPGPVDPHPPPHERVAPGYELDTLMREGGTGPAECRLDFDIANIGAHTFQTITIGIAVRLKTGRKAREEELPLTEPLEPDHRVTAQLELSSPCSEVAEVRLRGFTRCTIDTVQLGACRPAMLMHSSGRIGFGL